MGRRLVSVKYRVDGGPVAGGSGYELNVYDDETLATPSTLYQRGTGGGTQPNPMKPNAGMQSALLADRALGDAFVTVNDVTGFQVGDLVPIYDGTNTVYRVITIITPATKRLDLDSTLGVAFTVAAGTLVGNEDVTGHIWFYVDDAADRYAQPVEVASGRKLPPMVFPVRVPGATIQILEEGAAAGTQPAVNFISVFLTATNDVPNNRVNVTGPTAGVAPTTSAVADAAAEGANTTIARSDHKHGREAFATPTGTGYANAAGAATTIPRSDHVHDVDLTTASADLGSDQTIGTAGTYTDGPTVSLAAGTWLVTATLTVEPDSNSAHIAARISTGSTHYASAQSIGPAAAGAGSMVSLSVSAIITLGSTTTIKAQATSSLGTTSKIKAATSTGGSGNNASHIRAVRVT